MPPEVCRGGAYHRCVHVERIFCRSPLHMHEQTYFTGAPEQSFKKYQLAQRCVTAFPDPLARRWRPLTRIGRIGRIVPTMVSALADVSPTLIRR